MLTRSIAACRTWNCEGMSCGEKLTVSLRRWIQRPGGSFTCTRLSYVGPARMKPKAVVLPSLQISTEPFAQTEADKEQFMRTLKIGLVITFFLAALTPAISTRVAALTATLAEGKSSQEKAGKKKDAAQSKQSQPVDSSQYVGGESCAECHAAEAIHYALTAHNKTNVGNA